MIKLMKIAGYTFIILILYMCANAYSVFYSEQVKEKMHSKAMQLAIQTSVVEEAILNMSEIAIEMKIEQEEKQREIEKLKIEEEKRLEQYNKDLDLLSRLIYAEADKTSERDMLYVGNVVLNRVEHEAFPGSIYDVIYATGQYSPTWNGAINNTPSDLAIRCAERLMNGERFLPSNVVFQAGFKQGGGVYEKVGNHYFCYL